MNTPDKNEYKPFEKLQIERILSRYNPTHRQQKSNMKNKFNKGTISTGMAQLLYKEIEFLNNRIELQNRLLDVSPDEFIIYKP